MLRTRLVTVALITAAAAIGGPGVAAADGGPCSGDGHVGLLCQKVVTVPGAPATVRDDPRTPAVPARPARPASPARPRSTGGAPAAPGPLNLDFAGPIDIVDGQFACTAPVGTPCPPSFGAGGGLKAFPRVDPGNPVVTGLQAGARLGQVPAAPVPTVTPEQVAQTAIAQLNLAPPPIHMAPEPGTDGPPPTFPVWMWLEPGPSSTGPARSTATVAGVTVTVAATLASVTWDMGDGQQVICAGAAGAGTPFAPDQAGKTSPTCGYAGYPRSRAGSTVAVTATSTWTVTWQGGGAAGQQTIPTTAAVQLPIKNIPVVAIDPAGGN